MKRSFALGLGLALVTAAAAVGAPSAGAAVTYTPVVGVQQTIEPAADPATAAQDVSVYFVHGLNLDGQTDWRDGRDGGTPVTICLDESPIFVDFQFGDSSPAVVTLSETPLALSVHAGDGGECSSPALITQTVTPPATPASAIVITAAQDAAPSFLVVELDVSSVCARPGGAGPAADPPDSRVGVVHAAGVGEVVATIGEGDAEDLSFGDGTFTDVVNGEYGGEVTLGGTTVVDTAVGASNCLISVVYVVGNVRLGEPDPGPDPGPGPTPEPTPEPEPAVDPLVRPVRAG